MPTHERLIDQPARFNHSLANVISKEGDKETTLGQAWLAAPGRLITCGHVVETAKPQALFLKFPASGNLYPVKTIRLHPAFVRQPDQLVKFDLALLEAELKAPENSAQPLPFSYESALKSGIDLWTMRYPAHLGQLSAAIQPLIQNGKFLGLLRKHDNFHLLHDLPLSPGDSGAPITDGRAIVAIHCGDTATLPGLNLPTTSIRLALWVDALREFGIAETQKAALNSNLLAKVGLVFVLSFLLTLFALYQIAGQDLLKKWSFDQPKIMPVHLGLNRPIHGYKLNEDIEVNLIPGSNTYVFLLQIDRQDNIAVLYPQFGISPFLKGGESRTINYFGRSKLTANPSPDQWHLIAIDGNSAQGKEIADTMLTNEDWPAGDREGKPLLIKGKTFLKRLETIEEQAKGTILHAIFDSPRSST
ncbi:MAG: trypsin-like peptidase domain-containing protein [Candidatus Obscuribacterales bacterium]|nr:trypsin-like peptidase domain-containing protein [Candidatus Obscuribacterales bacterium]